MLDSSKKTPSIARALHAIAPPSEDRSFAQDVVLGLSSTPKRLPCKYFYDARGSALFDQITELPEYYPTRTEVALMRAHAAKMAATIGADALLVELGSGSSIKTRLLLDELERPAGYVPVDISAAHLQQAANSIAADYPGLEVMPVAADFTRGFEIPRPSTGAARSVVYFPGSTIGNFTSDRALKLLQAIAGFVGANQDERAGGLLLGFDLVKPTNVLLRAYDDAQGVTAAFNLNLLERINRELNGNFELAHFQHHAIWNAELARVELYIRSTRAQVVHVAGHPFEFAAGELMLTEYSHKYTRDSIQSLARQAGFERSTIWTDPEQLFGVGLFQLAD
ncbi:hypothetical protein DB30_01065 [Enhygromyxa salina]|uniref:Histidine-specific methyltransferase SAM-dependent domain-containing protein n=1 Tax=Enhygromyxa salina TaxID=215803 RepID=A0A0C2CY26_9BACT|nr:L-histidine N(alpha)-methyltransferase [Enhygromyxa salina]KIG12707.1 hypothetical protein DB30_01065 [Enhygromyxa salina]